MRCTVHVLKFTVINTHPHAHLSLVVQIGDAATEGEIFEFVIGSCRATERNAYLDKAGLRRAGFDDDADVSSRETHSHPPGSNPTEVNLTRWKGFKFEPLEEVVER